MLAITHTLPLAPRPVRFIALSRSADQSEDDGTAKDGSHVYGMTAMEAFLTIEFWLMVAIGFLVVGCGLMVINNIGEWEASKPASSVPSSVLQDRLCRQLCASLRLMHAPLQDKWFPA